MGGDILSVIGRSGMNSTRHQGKVYASPVKILGIERGGSRAVFGLGGSP